MYKRQEEEQAPQQSRRRRRRSGAAEQEVPQAAEAKAPRTEDVYKRQLEDFINTELLLMIGFGVSFELPLIVFYLAVFHIVPYASFRADVYKRQA